MMDLRIIYIILIAILLISFLSYFKFKNKITKLSCGLLICISIITGCILAFKPILDNTNYGLDLQGGFEVLYQV